MISEYMFHRIRKLKQQGDNNTQIAKKLKIDRETVAKYLQARTTPTYTPREKPTREDLFIPFKTKVENWLDKSRELNSTEVFELLIEEGYKGSLSTVKRRLALLKKSKDKERFFEQVYEFGEQCQFDFKERIKIPFNDGAREVHLHFATLPCSNKFFIRCYPSKNHECFADGIHEFFQHIGGITKNIRIDNLSPCVKKVLAGNDRLYTDSFKKVIDYYDFKVLPCRPGMGNDKGDVERDIRTYANKILKLLKLKDVKFDSFCDANKWLLDFCNKRMTDEVREKFELEKKSLKNLLDKRDDILCRVDEIAVNSYGIIKASHDNIKVSVPDKFIGKKCRIFYGTENIVIKHLDSNKVIATHPRYQGDSILLEHVINSISQKPAAMIRWAHKEALYPRPIYKRLYKRLKKIRSWRAEQDYLKILNLIHNIELDELSIAIELALEADIEDLMEKIQELVLVKEAPENVIQISQQLEQKNISTKLETYDSLIPKGEASDPQRTSKRSGNTKTKCNEGRVYSFSEYSAKGKK